MQWYNNARALKTFTPNQRRVSRSLFPSFPSTEPISPYSWVNWT